jgi:hypothetical protein
MAQIPMSPAQMLVTISLSHFITATSEAMMQTPKRMMRTVVSTSGVMFLLSGVGVER